MKNVIAVFDIGKTNKKVILFDQNLQVVFEHEERFPTITDEDGIECDDIDLIENWIKTTVETLATDESYNLLGVNFSTYGATLMYIGKDGKRLTPVYNYLKAMPEGVVEPLYGKWGGVEEFCRKTASPAKGMLNSGLQALWLKKIKPDVFTKVDMVLNFPQYLSYILTGKLFSEYTSIGCHTAMWDFDVMQYHPWLADEGIPVPQPIGNDHFEEITIKGKRIKIGIGIHDSSASLAPYVLGSPEKFILMSTGTWCISMNPFNDEPLTADQLSKDCLCYMSVSKKPVKSSQLFMGHIHDVNVKRLTDYFQTDGNSYKKVKPELNKIKEQIANPQRHFFKAGVPNDYIDSTVDLSVFDNFESAYHQLIFDLTELCVEALELIIPKIDEGKNIYIAGGFAKNEIFVRYLALQFPSKKVYTSVVDNATALGTALVLWEKINKGEKSRIDLGLKEWVTTKPPSIK